MSHIGSEILFRKNLWTVNGAAASAATASATVSSAAAANSLCLLVASLCWPATCFCCLRFALVIRCAQETRDAAFRCCSGSVASLQKRVFHLLPLVNSPSKLFPLRVLSFHVVVVLTNTARAFCRVFLRVVKRRVQQMALCRGIVLLREPKSRQPNINVTSGEGSLFVSLFIIEIGRIYVCLTYILIRKDTF